MKFKEIISKACEKAKAVASKIGRKGGTVICAAILVLSAVVLNVVLFTNKGDGNIQTVNTPGGEDTETVSGGAEDYFASVSISKNRARDEAVDVLLEVTEDENSSESAKESAMAEMERIAVDIENECKIETMVKAKGFAECVAVISGGSANVIVKSDTLTPGETAQISEIVYDAAGITPTNLKIIEKSE